MAPFLRINSAYCADGRKEIRRSRFANVTLNSPVSVLTISTVTGRHVPFQGCDRRKLTRDRRIMATSIRMAHACGSMFLAVGVLAATSAAAENGGKIGPALETVKAFGDDFRLVGIGVSAKAGCSRRHCSFALPHGRGR